MGRLNATYVSLDCRPNCMESQAKGKYRDKQSKPLPGAGGDLARSCDDQLLGVFRAVKRIAEERELLIERRDRERERGQLDDAYDTSTDEEAERYDDVESEQQASDADGDGQDVPSDGDMSDDASALPESVSGGDGCSSGDQQGHVLPFGYDLILICLTPGCNRRRRVTHNRGYVSQRCRGGAREAATRQRWWWRRRRWEARMTSTNSTRPQRHRRLTWRRRRTGSQSSSLTS